VKDLTKILVVVAGVLIIQKALSTGFDMDDVGMALGLLIILQAGKH
jgi:hypothetical protein